MLEDVGKPMLWVYYLQGRIALAEDDQTRAEDCFLELKKMVADAARAPEDDELRLAAMALKRLGAIERTRKDFLRAVGYHATAYAYLLRAGSFRELHDVAVSLDVDHFMAGDAPGSLCWGQRSLEFAEHIEDDRSRHRCMGMSLNNLAMWHADIGDPARGVELAEQSRECWTSYEEIAGAAENRLIWAEYGVGYAQAKLADATDGDDAAATARASYDRALELAEQRGLNDDDVQPIRDARAELDG